MLSTWGLDAQHFFSFSTHFAEFSVSDACPEARRILVLISHPLLGSGNLLLSGAGLRCLALGCLYHASGALGVPSSLSWCKRALAPFQHPL